MPAGDFPDRLHLQSRDDEQGPWITFASVWGRIEPNGSDACTITLRSYLEGIVPNMQVLFKDKEFQIQSVAYGGRRTPHLAMECLEVTGIVGG